MGGASFNGNGLLAATLALAESGVSNPERAADVADLGYRLALVGTALMRSTEPSRLLEQMLTSARQVVLGAHT